MLGADGHGYCLAVVGLAVAELSEGVVAPAVDAVVGINGTGGFVAGRHCTALILVSSPPFHCLEETSMFLPASSRACGIIEQRPVALRACRIALAKQTDLVD